MLPQYVSHSGHQHSQFWLDVILTLCSPFVTSLIQFTTTLPRIPDQAHLSPPLLRQLQHDVFMCGVKTTEPFHTHQENHSCVTFTGELGAA